MSLIEFETDIKSSIEICFDLSTSIDLHRISTAKTNEKAIAGITSGLIKSNEFVTWQATHLGVKQKLTSKITAYNRPFHFRDEQIKGPFKFIIHDHFFEVKDSKVIMKDRFKFQSPFGFVGKLFDKIFLSSYLRKFIIQRNNVIKEYAETSKWKSVLKEKHL